MTILFAGAILVVAAYVGFKILTFVASMMIKMVLFLAIMAAAAYFAVRMIWY